MMRFDRVCAGYGGVPCLHEISASLREGELIGLIGPNGSGKSTLLKVAAGSLRPPAVGCTWAKLASAVCLSGRSPARSLICRKAAQCQILLCASWRRTDVIRTWALAAR